VDLDASKNLLTLKHDRDSNLEVKTTPTTGITVDEYRIDIKRTNSATWYVLSTNKTMTPWHANAAGGFHLRGMAKIGGTECYSTNVVVEVRFPSAAEIQGGAGVQVRMDQAWSDTRTATTTNSRREEGYYITLDTSSNAYGIVGHTIGTPVANDVGASWDTATFPRPADSIVNPSPLDTVTYTVGWFHTHTPTTYRSVGRGVGPSVADGGWSSDPGINIPGYAYDYVESPAGSGSIPAGHPIDSPAQIYTITPPVRRPTP